MDLRRLHKAARDAQRKSDERWASFHAAVRDALADGQSATQVARDLDVSRGRVYQWRDKAR